MTNAEAYIGDEDLIDQFIDEFNNFACKQDCDLEYHGLKERLVEFFKQERTPTLTDDEEVILRNLKSYDTIGRTESGYLIVRDRHTIPMEDDEYAYSSMYGFNHLFQFIKERRRI